MTGLAGHGWLAPLLGDPDVDTLWSAEAQLSHMIAFEAAWSRALEACGAVPKGQGEAAARTIEEARIEPADLLPGTLRDGVPVPALVSVLRGKVGDPASVHRGATSQDVMDTALALTLRAVNDRLDRRLVELVEALLSLEERVQGRRLTGRTRMQSALPIPAQRRIEAWRRPLQAQGARLPEIRKTLEVLQVGGPVGVRPEAEVPIAQIAEHLTRLLDLPDPGFAWHSERAGLADYASWLSSVSGSLGKLGQDIALMAQSGATDIVLAGGGTSSAMPHKSNPVLAELLVTLARFNAGALSGVHNAIVHEQERSGAAWMLEWILLPQMTTATARGLSAASDLVDKIESVGAHE